jgi:NAD(P)-dependent dehydrogenase (short-subunit alcohol dehydrogenase family)
MSFLQNRIAIVTGAGQGLGRAEALTLAEAGATVVVNDFGPEPVDGGPSPAQAVVDEIATVGGRAVANTDDVADPAGAQRLIEQAFALDGHLDVLVCNAGIIRDRMLHKMSIEEWDSVIGVHLRGHFLPTRYAADRWRVEARESGPVNARVIYTTSEVGLFGHISQANYSAAKAGITGLCFTAAQELERTGVTVNTVAPRGRTPATFGTFGEIPRSGDGFDEWDPANVGPFVAFLARDEAAGITGQVFIVHGGTISRLAPWADAGTISVDHRWESDELLEAVREILPDLSAPPPVFPVEVG